MEFTPKFLLPVAVAAFVAVSPAVVLADHHGKGASEKGQEMMNDKAKEMMDKRDTHKEMMDEKQEEMKKKAKDKAKEMKKKKDK